MVTVSVTTRDTKLGLFALMSAWLEKDASVYPRSAVYPDATQSQTDDQQQGEVQMVTSQDTATAVALQALGYKVGDVVQVAAVQQGAPASGLLQAGDVIVSVDGTKVATPDATVAAIQSLKAGDTVHLGIQRGSTMTTIDVPLGTSAGKPFLGIEVGAGYRFPFKVNVNMDPNIGGPSAGLMFSLSIYDLLTPGSLTDGNAIAGTGEIEPDGSVGPIGGIQQKIPAAQHAGAKLLLVPASNCPDAIGADNGSMRLVKVTTMQSALQAIQTWTQNHNAALPSCSTNESAGTES